MHSPLSPTVGGPEKVNRAEFKLRKVVVFHTRDSLRRVCYMYLEPTEAHVKRTGRRRLIPERNSPKPYEAGRQAFLSPLKQIEVCWRMVGLQEKVITCAVYQPEGPGVELRCGYADDYLLHSARVEDVERARALAEGWKQTVLAKRSFTELPLDAEGA